MIHALRTIFLLVLMLFTIQTGLCAAETPISPDALVYPALHFDPPKSQKVVLDNGITLFIIENHELPIVRISAFIRAGTMYDPIGREGLSELTATVLRTGGTISQSGDSVDQEIDFRAADISFGTTMERCSADLTMHKKDADPIMRLFAKMLREPAFDPSKLAIARDLMLESLSRLYDAPQKLAFREFRRLIYDGNPRGRLPTQASILGLTQKELSDFHRRFFHPRNLTLAVTGDFTTEQAVALVRRHLGDWQPASGPAWTLPDLPLPQPRRSETIYFLPKDTPQSTVLLGYVLAGQKDPDFYALSLLDFILGSGGFRSRITREIRNDRGLAYSAGGGYSPRADFGVLQTYAMTRTSATADVASLMERIVSTLRSQPVVDEELSWAKRSIINQHIFSMEHPHQITCQQALLDIDGLPADFMLTYPQHIAMVTAQDIQKVAGKYLGPGRGLLFILGSQAELSTLSSIGKVITIDWTK